MLKHPDETKNRAVYVQSACVTQNELLAIAKKVRPDFAAETKAVNVAQLEKDSVAKMERGEDVSTAAFNLIAVGVYGEQYASSWDTKNDNKLLGIKDLSQSELDEVVLSCF